MHNNDKSLYLTGYCSRHPLGLKPEFVNDYSKILIRVLC